MALEGSQHIETIEVAKNLIIRNVNEFKYFKRKQTYLFLENKLYDMNNPKKQNFKLILIYNLELYLITKPCNVKYK